MSNKLLLTEYSLLEYDASRIKEAIELGEDVFLTGKIQEAMAENANNRRYPKEILMREVDNYQAAIGQNRAYGELDHPDDTVINLKNVSHIMTDIWWDGNKVLGKIKLLDTPSGNIAKQIMKSGGSLGISSRGVGSTAPKGNGDNQFDMVKDDYNLICFDLVSEPSTSGAFMLPENRQRYEPQTKTDKLIRMMNDILYHDIISGCD